MPQAATAASRGYATAGTEALPLHTHPPKNKTNHSMEVAIA